MPNFLTASTLPELRAQWTNPTDILSILLIIGGDIVQKALASTTGGWFTPVCFSFGWVSYSFSTLLTVLGDGRLLPAADYAVSIYDKSGYRFENKHWVVGRLFRDHESLVARRWRRSGRAKPALRVTVYEALPQIAMPREASRGVMTIMWMATLMIQVGIAAVPLGLYGEWGVFLITCAGSISALVTGALPQWVVEKYPQRQSNYGRTLALTSGNGSRDILVIKGCQGAVDWWLLGIGGYNPRDERAWESTRFSKIRIDGGMPVYRFGGGPDWDATTFRDLPVGFWVTRITCVVQWIFWLALLITVAGLKAHSWYLLIIGTVGMIQNAAVAAVDRLPERRYPLKLIEEFGGQKVMDTLMDLEITCPGIGNSLLPEFFPGALREDEVDWWQGNRDSYDDRRVQQKTRGNPRSRQNTVSPTAGC